jgi:riboflavin kinase
MSDSPPHTAAAEQATDHIAMIHKLLPIRMTSQVIRGFGRGSKDLGIPTANLDLDQLVFCKGSGFLSTNESFQLDNLPCGIYWGFGQIGEEKDARDGEDALGRVYTTALSIGYNPTYGNGKSVLYDAVLLSYV